MNRSSALRSFIPAAFALALGACASMPVDRGRADVQALLQASNAGIGSTVDPPERQARIDALLDHSLDADGAVEIAWLHSPRVRLALAELGLAAADLFETGRLHNPTFSASRIGGSAGTSTVGISAIVTDLVALPARRRIGQGHWRSAVARAAHVLVDEAASTRADYYTLVGAGQVAAMRDAMAEAAEASAELARRFHAAGNISALQLAREEAAATQARIRSAKAGGDRLAARMALADRMGLAGRTNRWRTTDSLPLPLADDLDTLALLELARERRLDVAAARAALDAGEDMATFARRFGWLGEVELGFEREREDGRRESGPTLSLTLPLFQQGQAGRARAAARRDMAREQLALYELGIEKDVRTGVARLAAQRQIVDGYRNSLIPQRQSIVAGELERYNYMLIGAFDLIQARQLEYDAYQGYVEAIRDYWLARTELARAAGGSLPGDDLPSTESPSIRALLEPGDGPPGGDPHMHHSRHPEKETSR